MMLLVKRIGPILERVIERLSSAGLLLSGVMLVLSGLLVSQAAARRYLLQSSEPYSYEISVVLLVAAINFAIPAVQRSHQNIRVDFLVDRLPQGVQDILQNIICPILALFFVGTVTWQSWEISIYSLRMGEISNSSLAEPLWPVKMLVPIGFGLLCLVLFAQLCHGIISLKKKRKKTG